MNTSGCSEGSASFRDRTRSTLDKAHEWVRYLFFYGGLTLAVLLIVAVATVPSECVEPVRLWLVEHILP